MEVACLLPPLKFDHTVTDSTPEPHKSYFANGRFERRITAVMKTKYFLTMEELKARERML